MEVGALSANWFTEIASTPTFKMASDQPVAYKNIYAHSMAGQSIKIGITWSITEKSRVKVKHFQCKCVFCAFGLAVQQALNKENEKIKTNNRLFNIFGIRFSTIPNKD